MTLLDQVSLADAKSRLSEVIDGVQGEHRRVVITRHGKPAAILIAPEDLEALEETLDLLSDSEAMASLRQAEEDVATGHVEYLTKDEARARWVRG
jgi:prevent-host-death family protein